MSTRRGSFLVICITLVSLMIILSFAILHDIRAQIETSVGNQPYLLAQAAARSGLDHALENILTDYKSSTITVRQNGASVQLPAITFLDGYYRAPFTSIFAPNNGSVNVDLNAPTADNDVRAEDYVLQPWCWNWDDMGGWWNWGMLMYDGKGRYYEPGYYNVTPTTAGTAGFPVAPTLFLDPNAPAPERTQGMFYDDQFRRVPPSGNVQADRQAARYRLRYTVGVEDLSGHLLINPMPEMQMLAQTGPQAPPVDYRTPGARFPWMPAATNALASIIGGPNSGMFGAQMEHVFQGRGYHTNVDFDHSPSGLSGWPKTFPLMYRDSWQPNASSGNWGSFIDGINDPTTLATSLYWATPWGEGPQGLAAGGEIMPVWNWNTGTRDDPYDPRAFNHCLMGPQLSFDNATYAAHGERGSLGTQEGDGYAATMWDKFGITPFGRGLTSTGYNPTGQNRWYQGRVDTPFYLNVMTAPPGVVNGVLCAFLPPRVKIFQYTTIHWIKFTGLDRNNNRTYVELGNGMPIDGTLGINESSFYGRDLLVDTTAPPALRPVAGPDPLGPESGVLA